MNGRLFNYYDHDKGSQMPLTAGFRMIYSQNDKKDFEHELFVYS